MSAPTYMLLPSHEHSWRRYTWPLYLKRLQHSKAPILCGPWHGEVGFEVLYWIPFLHYLLRHGISADRIIPISRGGAAAWYCVPQGLELFAMRSPQDLRIERRLQHAKSGVQKQIALTPFDAAILKDAADTLKLTDYHVLHPAWMYHRLAPYWTGQRGPTWLTKRTEFATLGVPELPATVALPEVFVAAKFYARETWPLHHKLATSITAASLMKVADATPVVILDGSVHADEHLDFPVPVHPQILHLRDLTTVRPETNLALQSAVLAKAQGFIGTYGGMAQLALRLGKPSVTFYADWGGTAITHRSLSDLLSVHSGIAFQVFRATEIAMANFVLPIAEIQATGRKLDTSVKQELQPV